MERVEKYREIIEQILNDCAAIPYAHGEIERRVVVDKRNDQYLLVNVGWDGMRRIHGILVHIDIRDNKVWVERDSTEYGIVEALEAACIPKEDIVLGWIAQSRRQHTGYAVA
jgi:hypothetical protein